MAETLLIKDYANWIVADARQDCDDKGLKLKVENGDATNPKTEKGIIEKNGDKSKAGTPIEVGGIVGVIIHPLEPRQE